jgi:hypothetical protein
MTDEDIPAARFTETDGSATAPYGQGMALDRQFHSLEDFLASTMSHVDGVLDDGWGAGFPVKGREIEATVLFADITAFDPVPRSGVVRRPG